jgi:tRNA(fMet)-specific endonuclease VapC
MWILDTDHLTILERGGSMALPLQMRLGLVSVSDVATTIINYEEQMRG